MGTTDADPGQPPSAGLANLRSLAGFRKVDDADNAASAAAHPFRSGIPAAVAALRASVAVASPSRQSQAPLPLRPRRLASAAERKLAAGLAALLVIVAGTVAPLAHDPLVKAPGFIPAYSTLMIIINFMIAHLLIFKARIENDGSQMTLAAAFLFCGVMATLHLLSFPDALVPGIIAGTAQTASWTWVFWYGGFPILIIGYCARAGADRLSTPRLRSGATVCLLMVAAAGYLAFFKTHVLPALIRNDQGFLAGPDFAAEAVLVGLNIAAAALVLIRSRCRTAQDIWLAVSMSGVLAGILLGHWGGARYTVGWYGSKFGGLSSVLFILTSLLNDLLLAYKSVSIANDALDKLTLTDALTGLGNRRQFDQALANEWRRCRRDVEPLTVIVIDVDSFKAFNDAYGHQAGDACLQEIAGQLKRAVSRPGDVVVRYGGEEFALVLPATDSDGANHLCKLIRARIRDLAIPHEAVARGVITVSAGLASLVPSEHFEACELLKLADAALYRAKAAGRDTIVVAG